MTPTPSPVVGLAVTYGSRTVLTGADGSYAMPTIRTWIGPSDQGVVPLTVVR